MEAETVGEEAAVLEKKVDEVKEFEEEEEEKMEKPPRFGFKACKENPKIKTKGPVASCTKSKSAQKHVRLPVSTFTFRCRKL